MNGKDWKTWKKKYLIVDDYMLNKALDKIKEIKGIEKFDDAKFWLIKMINYQMILLDKTIFC